MKIKQEEIYGTKGVFIVVLQSITDNDNVLEQ